MDSLWKQSLILHRLLSKNLLNLMQTAYQGVDFFLGVVEGKRSPCRSRDAKAIHERLSAMMARTDSDAFAVEDRAQVMGMDAFEDEGQNTGFFLGRADKTQAGDFRDSSSRVFQKLVLMSHDRVPAQAAEVIKRGSEADGARNVGRAGLELVG